MWFLFIKQRVKFTISSISLLNGKRTNYSFSGLFCHTRQLSESPRSGTAGALCAAPSITSLCRLPAETRPWPRAPCTPHLQEWEASCCFLKNLSRGDLYPQCQWQGWREMEGGQRSLLRGALSLGSRVEERCWQQPEQNKCPLAPEPCCSPRKLPKQRQCQEPAGSRAQGPSPMARGPQHIKHTETDILRSKSRRKKI